MPSLRRPASAPPRMAIRRGRTISHTRRRPQGRVVRSKKTRASARSRTGQDVLNIKTLLPNVQKLKITYRDSINFTNMGAAGTAYTPTMMRFSLNDPNLKSGDPNIRIGTVIDQGGSNTAPSFVYENPSDNLQSELQPYYDDYEYAVVTKSKVKVNIRFKPNQKGVGQHFQNAGDGSEGSPYRLQVIDQNKVGDAFVWALSQRQTGTLTSQNPTLNQLKREIPGVQMKRMTLGKNGIPSKGVTFQASYTPARSAGVKDWKDNLAKFSFDETNRTQEDRYLYVGLTSQQQPLTPSYNLANVYVDYQVDYEITLLSRKNIYGANVPVGEPVGRADQMGA